MIMCCINCVICMLGESRKYNLRCSRMFWQNGPELNEKKKNFLDSSSSFEHK